jgi:glycosyltransferase involved in cell wall biosynthesis
MFTWKLIQESKDCSVIYALDPISVGVPALIASRITGKPLMLRIAGDYAWEQGQQRWEVTETLDEFVEGVHTYPIPVRVLWWLERYVARHAVRIVVPSEYMKGIITKWGIDADRVTRIYSALHEVYVSESREALRKSFEYNGIVVTTAARLVPWKGVHKLIEAVARLRKRAFDATLVVIGDGTLLEDLKRHAREHGIAEYVRFIGRQTRDATAAAIKASDVFVLNTSYEGLSHQLLEVMDIGVPIVTTPVGGNRELVEDGISGLFVPFNNAEEIASAIERAATHEQLRENLVHHARATAKRFSEKQVVTEFVELLGREFKTGAPELL